MTCLLTSYRHWLRVAPANDGQQFSASEGSWSTGSAGDHAEQLPSAIVSWPLWQTCLRKQHSTPDDMLVVPTWSVAGFLVVCGL